MAKIKSKSAFNFSIQHNNRERIPLNADQEKGIHNVYYNPDDGSHPRDRIDKKLPDTSKIRKNAVLGIEVLMTASPDFTGSWDEYLKAASKWAVNLFGIDNLIHGAIHMDETTPHAHFLFVPNKDGKLNANHFIGGSRDRMAELQSDFYEKVGKQFELERGQSKAETKARHTPHTLSKKAIELAEKEKFIIEKNTALNEMKKNLIVREGAVNAVLQSADISKKMLVRIIESLRGATTPEVNKFWPLFFEKIPDFVKTLLQQIRQEPELTRGKEQNRRTNLSR
jgi:hypothetical protein